MYGEGKRAVCISASNRMSSEEHSASYAICSRIQKMLADENVCCHMMDIGEFDLKPCTGCGQCVKSGKCMVDRDFNRIYESVSGADWCFIVSSRYAPIPAELCILLGKLKQIHVMLPGRKGSETDLEGKLAGIISYGGMGGWEPENCKAMVNDNVANVLYTLQMRVVPFNSKWDTGIALSVKSEEKEREGICLAKNETDAAEERLRNYVEVIVQTSKTLYALK